MMSCENCGRELNEGEACLLCEATVENRAATIRRQERRPAERRPANTSRFAPGTVLAGRYRVSHLLGRDGMGEVYRAEDQTLDQPVALKLLPKAAMRRPGSLERLFDEVRLARQISHPNICRVFDVQEAAEGLFFVAMELVDGEDLAALVKRIGRLAPERAREIGVELCRGLAAIHERGILHRDLKPANVMLDSEGRVRIMDFGLAVTATAVEGAAAVCGTPAYMAPEQHAGREATVRSDLYALGLLLYELFTGQRAFAGASGAELARLHREESPTPPSHFIEGLQPALERVILRCLGKDPSSRPSSAEAVEMGLRAEEELEVGTFLKTVVIAMGRVADAAELLEAHGGREIVTVEGPVWLFERPWAAVRFALAQQHIAAAPMAIHLGEVSLRRRAPGEGGAGPVTVDHGPALAIARGLAALARPEQIFLTRHAFDLARRGFEDDETTDLTWLAHGSFLFSDFEESLELFEVGTSGQAPFRPPEGKAVIWAVVEGEVIPGWRPAPGLAVPKRKHWRVRRRLGEGGFGEVWLARHEKTGERRVFKFCFEASRLRALRREITLFRLLKEELGERPDIARILDWSFDEAPYFIESEYSASGDLIEWIRSQGGFERVPLSVRLEIVAQAATALGAAHSVGILHKDVKPGNLLISTDQDSSVRVRLADFGVGQVFERQRLNEAAFTVEGMTVTASSTTRSSQSGTRLYMAPEILEGKRATLQSDIYALGVVLYQLLVGDFSRALAPGRRREIEDDLLAKDVADFVDGSLDRRPANALEVADRLRRLDERRAARQEAAALRRSVAATKRRKRLYKSIAVIAGLTLSIVSSFALWAFRVQREEARSRHAAERVTEFMVELFEVADPFETEGSEEKRGLSITAKEMLDRGAAKLGEQLQNEPVIRARLMATLGAIYRDNGLPDQAAPLLEEALVLRKEHLGDDHPMVARNLQQLAILRQQQGHLGSAELLFRESLALSRRIWGERHPNVAAALESLATLLVAKGDYESAEPLLREALARYRATVDEERPNVAVILHGLANLLFNKGDLQEAEMLLHEALALNRSIWGEEHPNTASTLACLVALYESSNQPQKAACYRDLWIAAGGQPDAPAVR